MNKSKLPVIKKSSRGDNMITLPRSTTYVVDSESSSTPKASKLTSTKQSGTGNKLLAPIRKEGTFTKPQPSSTVAPPPQVDSPNKKNMSLAMLKQQKRAELKKAQANGACVDDDIMFGAANTSAVLVNTSDLILTNQKSFESKLKEARKAGQLNLSNYGLVEGTFRINYR